jgi:hypothetical protein
LNKIFQLQWGLFFGPKPEFEETQTHPQRLSLRPIFVRLDPRQVEEREMEEGKVRVCWTRKNEWKKKEKCAKPASGGEIRSAHVGDMLGLAQSDAKDKSPTIRKWTTMIRPF